MEKAWIWSPCSLPGMTFYCLSTFCASAWRSQRKSMRRWKQRESYKPCVSVKNVSISHCPPGWGEGGREMKTKRDEGVWRRREMSRYTRQMDEDDNCRLIYKMNFESVFPLIQWFPVQEYAACFVITATNVLKSVKTFRISFNFILDHDIYILWQFGQVNLLYVQF